MSPSAVVLGILMGTILSIAFGLLGVSFIFWWLADDYPRFADEMPMLLRSAGLFMALSLAAVSSFIGVLRSRPWRHPCLGLLGIGLVATGWYYWP